MSSKINSNEINITRVYDASVKAVWEAWTDPEQVAKWWGPRGFSLTTHSKDLRPGGNWSYTMHGPDGIDYPNKTFYHEVEKCSKLVYDHGANDDRPPLFRVTVQFNEVVGKTKMEMTMALPSAAAAEQTRKFIKQAGGDATWDRLAEYLEKQIHGKEKFVISRTFECSVERMFELWTDPKHVSQWSAPKGFHLEFISVDIKPGGRAFYLMTDDKNVKMHGRTEYLRIEKPNLIVYIQQFCDELGELSRHPFSPTWPESILSTIQFTAESPARTIVTITWEPYGRTSADEMETFISSRAQMSQGWTGSLDKLEECCL